MTRKHDRIPPQSAIEANVCYYVPTLPVHLTLPLKGQEWVKFRLKKEYKEQFEDVKHLMRGRIVDSVLIRPALKNEKILNKANERLIDLVREYRVYCPLDYSGVLPRTSSGLARKSRNFEIDRKTISCAFTIFEYLFKEGIKMMKDSLLPEELIRMKDEELRLYMAMQDFEADKEAISFEELRRATGLDTLKLQEAIEGLRRKGAIYEPKRGYYLILPF